MVTFAGATFSGAWLAFFHLTLYVECVSRHNFLIAIVAHLLFQRGLGLGAVEQKKES